MIIVGAVSCGLGLYSTGLEIKDAGEVGKPFSCEDNSPGLAKQFVNGSTPLPAKF